MQDNSVGVCARRGGYLLPEIMAVSTTDRASFPCDIARSTTALISAQIPFCISSGHSLIQMCLHAGFLPISIRFLKMLS